MNSQNPVLVYVEDDENSILVMKMVVERVMGLPALYILQGGIDFVSRLRIWVSSRMSFCWIFI